MPTAIHEQIKILAELQKIDGEIYKLRKELSAQPLLQKKYEEDFERSKNGLKSAEAELKNFQLKQKEKEMELQTREERVKKLQAQLYQLKSNKEYSAMELEIKGSKADQSLLEEDILRLLDAVETAKARAAKEKESLAGEEKKFKEAIEASKKTSEELASQIAALEEKRKAYAPNIEPRLLSQYERILKSREGLALVPVKNNACGGCHMGLPPQVLHEVRLGEKMIVCETCARILYWAE
ncbi:MAG: hypothetical protein HYZ52_03295 [Candidatus Omnitrophica bacterium]|nr:hypothetical protein [Candidatus Omnitrophota bacterium]